MMRLFVCSLLFSLVSALSCAHLFPATGGFFAESCMFAGHGLFSSTAFAKNNQYFLLSFESPLDFERYTLKALDPHASSNATMNCQVLQHWEVYDEEQGKWTVQGESDQTFVNAQGPNVFLIPGVVPVSGMCVMTRLSGNACLAAAKTMVEAYEAVKSPLPVHAEDACSW